MTKKIIIRDRNNIAYLLVNGHNCEFVSNSNGGLDAEFVLTPELEISNLDYMGNRGVPVQSFVAACKYLGDRIREYRQRGGRP